MSDYFQSFTKTELDHPEDPEDPEGPEPWLPLEVKQQEQNNEHHVM